MSRLWADLVGDLVKYQAFLRKQTRYNPTRGGEFYPHTFGYYQARNLRDSRIDIS